MFVDRYIYIISAIFIYSSGIFVVCAISFSDHHLQDKTFRVFFQRMFGVSPKILPKNVYEPIYFVVRVISKNKWYFM